MENIIEKIEGVINDMYVDWVQYVPPFVQATVIIGVIFCLMFLTYLIAN